jgi:hypothetical protein
MSEEQAITADSRVVANRDGPRRVDESHLHDLAVPADGQTGIRELQSPAHHLLVDFRAIAYRQVRRVQERE